MLRGGTRRFTRLLAVLLVGGLFVSLAATSELITPSALAVPRTDLLPDLQMAPLFGVALEQNKAALELHFGTLVNNVGDGAMVVRGRFPRNDNMRRIVQLISQMDGPARVVHQPDAVMYFEPEGVHSHWHLKDFITMRLTSLETSATPDRLSTKIGFCFFDTTRLPRDERPQNSTPKVFSECGTETSRRVRMGISVGWGDAYLPEYEFQDIDVTGLRAGSYRLCATVNPQGIWLEKAPDNNSYWVDLRIQPSKLKVTILDQGATPC